MSYPTSDCWIAEIKTDSYAGNFEREMTAYCTGLVGDCGVGQELADLFHKEVEGCPFDEWGEFVPDEHGCFRPCSLGGVNSQSVLIFLNLKPEPRHLDLIFKRAKEFAERQQIIIYLFELQELIVRSRISSHPWESE